MKIIFTDFYEVKDAEAKKYKLGDIFEGSDASCNHFINRGVAKEYAEPVKVSQTEKSKK